jgi:hypothetical protein
MPRRTAGECHRCAAIGRRRGRHYDACRRCRGSRSRGSRRKSSKSDLCSFMADRPIGVCECTGKAVCRSVFCYDGFGHDAPVQGCVVASAGPSFSTRGGSGRLQVRASASPVKGADEAKVRVWRWSTSCFFCAGLRTWRRSLLWHAITRSSLFFLPWLVASRCVPPCSEAATSRRVRAREEARRRTGHCHRAPAASRGFPFPRAARALYSASRSLSRSYGAV